MTRNPLTKDNSGGAPARIGPATDATASPDAPSDQWSSSRLRHTAAVTLDGQRVELLANIELPGDAQAALHCGAVGVGLFRSEFLFMGRAGELPDEEEQYQAYCRAVEGMKGLPVTIRTIDVGAEVTVAGAVVSLDAPDPHAASSATSGAAMGRRLRHSKSWSTG